MHIYEYIYRVILLECNHSLIINREGKIVIIYMNTLDCNEGIKTEYSKYNNAMHYLLNLYIVIII